MNCFCTLFDHRYLDRGLALYHSLVAQKENFTLWVLCLDGHVYDALSESGLEYCELVRLSELESWDMRLLTAKENRSLVEYYFTCKPILTQYLFEQNPEYTCITYLDADLCFLSSYQELYDAMSNYSIGITPHRFCQAKEYLNKFGKYNAGFISFKRDDQGLACLRWWGDRCIEWCCVYVENERFADQKYIDQFFELFENVLIFDSYGINLAPWNIEGRELSQNGGKLFVDGKPLVCYHFHGLKKTYTYVYDLGVSKYLSRVDKKILDFIYRPYLMEIKKRRIGEKVTLPPLSKSRDLDQQEKGKDNLLPIALRHWQKIKVTIKGILHGTHLIQP